MSDNKFDKKVRILNGRCYACDCEKDCSDKFPFDIERFPNESDEHYKGYCDGMESMFDLARRGDLADKGIIYNEDFKDECGECEDCPCFNDGFDMGFKHGQKVAREELEDDIYINGYKIDRIDDLRQKVITLGHHIPFEHREAIDEILEDLTSLIKDEAMEAVNDYLGYR